MPSHSSSSSKEVRFFPNVLLAEACLAIAAIGLMIVFVSLFPLRLGEKFDPLNPPSLLEPEWYFMGVYQVLKTQNAQPIDGIILLTGLAIFMILVPFIDRGKERSPLRRPAFIAFAFFALTEFLGLTIFGYMSPGEVGSFALIPFTLAFVVTNGVAVGLVLLVFEFSKRSRPMG